jgi:predicted AlkP superfamily phosphohydrolase/phosphomutase
MGEPSRILIVGIDGATWNVLDPWISDGSLPNLGGRRKSSWEELFSTIPPVSAPAWSILLTGS